MTSKNLFKAAFVLVGTALAVTTVQLSPAFAEYSLTVTNQTRTRIKQVLVSENGKNWGYFDIGSGIAPGETAKLVWDKSTDNESCSQLIKAVYADGSQAQPAKFDFCEETDLVFE